MRRRFTRRAGWCVASASPPPKRRRCMTGRGPRLLDARLDSEKSSECGSLRHRAGRGLPMTAPPWADVPSAGLSPLVGFTLARLATRDFPSAQAVLAARRHGHLPRRASRRGFRGARHRQDVVLAVSRARRRDQSTALGSTPRPLPRALHRRRDGRRGNQGSLRAARDRSLHVHPARPSDVGGRLAGRVPAAPRHPAGQDAIEPFIEAPT